MTWEEDEQRFVGIRGVSGMAEIPVEDVRLEIQQLVRALTEIAPTKYAGNPILPQGWSEAFALYHDKEYHLYGDGGVYQHSANGIDGWIDEGVVLPPGAPGEWDDFSCEDLYVFVDWDGMWHCVYQGRNVAGENRIGYATSTDGKTWTKYAGNPIIDELPTSLEMPSLLKWREKWYLYYVRENYPERGIYQTVLCEANEPQGPYKSKRIVVETDVAAGVGPTQTGSMRVIPYMNILLGIVNIVDRDDVPHYLTVGMRFSIDGERWSPFVSIPLEPSNISTYMDYKDIFHVYPVIKDGVMRLYYGGLDNLNRFWEGFAVLPLRNELKWTIWDNVSTGTTPSTGAPIGGMKEVTLFLKVNAACVITIEMAQDDEASDWFEVTKVTFTAAGTDTVPLSPKGKHVRVTSDTDVTGTCKVYGVRK